MRRQIALFAGSAALLAASPALPCGAPFGNGIQVDPKQDIIVVWKDNVETYVFQPTFCGTASDFGLILPVPSQLTKAPELVEQTAFTKAAALSEPQKVKVSSSSGGCGSMGGTEGKAGGALDIGPTVVASGRVGFLDWTQLKAETTASFTDWLTTNGYPYSAAAATAFSYYVEQGWYFLAFKISQDVAPGGATVCKALGPISLSFPSAVPVVPARMGSVGATVGSSGSSTFKWRVFGITYGNVQMAGGSLGYSGAIKDSDVPAFAGLAQIGDRLTRFYLTFYSGSTLDDRLGTVSANDFRAIEYVPDDSSSCRVGRSSTRHDAFLALFSLGFLGLLLWRRRR